MLVTTQSTAGIIEKSYNFWSKTLFIVLTTWSRQYVEWKLHYWLQRRGSYLLYLKNFRCVSVHHIIWEGSTDSSPHSTSLSSRFANSNLRDFPYHTASSAQEQPNVMPRSVSQNYSNNTVALGQAFNPMDNFTSTNGKWSTSGMSFCGSMPILLNS